MEIESEIESGGDLDLDLGRLLPWEIVEEILSRVEVKALLRFRCVSKSWQSTIDSERFIRKHLKNSSRRRFAISDSSNSWDMWRCSLASLLSSKEPEFDDLKYNMYPRHQYHLTLVGCCDGLVCLLWTLEEFILWNPSTRISRRLPPLPLPQGFYFPSDRDAIILDFDRVNATGSSLSEGFGYDESSGDYKVVSLIHLTPLQGSELYSQTTYTCCVYSLKSNSWKTVKGGGGGGGSDRCFYGQGIYVGGKLHWLAGREDVKNIVSFDMSREARGVVEIPHDLDKFNKFEGKLWKHGECLSLLCYYPATPRIDVWVMINDWHKLVTVKDNAVFDMCNNPMDHLFYININININGDGQGRGGGGGGGEIIFLENSSFLIYYPDGCCSKRVGNKKYYKPGIYSESLVQL